jgi:cobalt-zinc-cadmium efflux system outer membrane protein
MKKQICAILILINLMSNAGLLLAAEETLSSAEALSLDQSLRIAYVKNPRMIEARKSISAAKGRWIQAEALPDPELELEVGGYKKNEDGVRDKSLDAVSVSQPLDPLGTRFLRGRIAYDSVRIAKGDLNLVWGEVRKQIIELYARIQAEEKAQEIALDNLNATRQFFTRVETRFQSGNALQSDAIRARIEVSRAENDLLIRQKNLKVSKGEMNLALGRSVESPLSLSESLGYVALRYEYEKIKSIALEQRADIRNEKTRLSSRKKGFWSALLKTFFPQMAIGVERTTEEYENDTSLLLKASYPLWGFNLGAVKEAKAEKDIQKVRLEALERQVGLEVYRAFLEAELTDQQVTLQKKALDEANELLRQITLQYESGEVPFLTYLENIKTIKETRLAYFNVLKDYKEKVAELERVIQATPAPEGVKQ